MIDSDNQPHPSEVYGYDNTKVRRILPTVPRDAPVVQSNVTTAGSVIRRRSVARYTAAGILVAGLVTRFATNAEWVAVQAYHLVGLWLLGGIGIVVSLTVAKLSTREAYDTLLLETAHGYTTWGDGGGHSRAAWVRPFLVNGWVAGQWAAIDPCWNLKGVWVLTWDGKTVIAEPDRTVLPPGMYPSPVQLGLLQFWSGQEWGRTTNLISREFWNAAGGLGAEK
jgi:hypothetical protein